MTVATVLVWFLGLAAIEVASTDGAPRGTVPDDAPAAWSSWLPSGSAGVTDSAVPLEQDLDSCGHGEVAGFDDAAGGRVTRTWIPCLSDAEAGFAREFLVDAYGGAVTGRAVLGDDVDVAVRTSRNGVAVVGRVWVQGSAGYAVTRRCGSDLAACVRANDADVAAVSALVPGTAVSPHHDVLTAPGELVTIALSAWVLFVLPWRVVGVLRRQRYPSRDVPGLYTDLQREVNRQRWTRYGRRASATVVVLLGASIAGGVAAGTWLAASVSLVLAAGGVALWVWCRRGRLRFERPAGGGRGEGLLHEAGRLVRTSSRAAVAALGVLVVVLVLCSFLTSLSQAGLEWQRTDAGLDPSPGGQLRYVLVTIALALRIDASWLWVFGILVPLLVTYLVSRLARRLMASGVDAVLESSGRRAAVLYLRSFDEDRLTLPATWSRRGLLERLAPVRRRRFEELLASALDIVGPVVAISPPGTRLPPLGAARITLSNDQWQDRVRAWAADAAVIVLSATPREIRDGYQWELDLVGARLGASRVLLVVAPHRRDEVVRRFGEFLRVTWGWSFPLHGVPSGVHVAAWHPTRGWAAFGARTRTDVSYALAIRSALRWYDADRPAGVGHVTSVPLSERETTPYRGG